MAAFFLDSSALVKRYVPEVGSPWITSLVRPAKRHRVYVARITSVGMASALARRARDGETASRDARDAGGHYLRSAGRELEEVGLRLQGCEVRRLVQMW